MIILHNFMEFYRKYFQTISSNYLVGLFAKEISGGRRKFSEFSAIIKDRLFGCVSWNISYWLSNPFYQPLRSGRIWHKVNF